MKLFAWPGNPYWRDRLGTVYLLELTGLDQFISKLKILLTSFTKQATPNEVVNRTENSPLVSLPWINYNGTCTHVGVRMLAWPGNPYWRGRLGTVDLLELTGLYRLISKLKVKIFLSYKTIYLNEEANCTEPSSTLIKAVYSIVKMTIVVVLCLSGHFFKVVSTPCWIILLGCQVNFIKNFCKKNWRTFFLRK